MQIRGTILGLGVALACAACGGGDKSGRGDDAADAVDSADAFDTVIAFDVPETTASDTTTSDVPEDSAAPDTDAVAVDTHADTEVADATAIDAGDDADVTADDTHADEGDADADVAGDTATADVPVEVVIAPPPPLVVNELDCRGAPSDWAEIVNVGTTPVSIDGLFVTDAPTNASHRQPLGLAGATLQPGDHLVVPITDFGIDCTTEGVTLVDDGGRVIDAAPPGDNPAGYTWGRLPDATGDFAVNAPTPGAVNAAPDLNPFDPIGSLYDPNGDVLAVDFTIPDEAYASLQQNPYDYVSASVTLTDSHGATTVPVAIRLKGQIGSFRSIDGKAGFKVSFDRFWPGARFRGVKMLTLNNMVQDGAKTHEALAYAFFRAMGVPAPRVGYAWVTVNGQPRGLYSDIESYEEPWLSEHFDSTLALFEGEYGDDLFTGSEYTFDLDAGDESGRLALKTLIDAVNGGNGAGFMARTAPYVDWDEVIADMATEVFIGHWDGYAPTRNNYDLHVDDSGVWTLMPWGTDQTFGDHRDLHGGEGLLLQGCLSDGACRVKWDAALLRLEDLVNAGTIQATYATVPAHLQPWEDQDTNEGSGVDIASQLQASMDFLTQRVQEVEAQIGCERDPAQDADHDGYACILDCDDNDPARHVGATDVCGNGIDEDCDGITDGDPTCPDCTPQTFGGEDYLFCTRPRSHDDAVAECASYGDLLIVVDDEAENTWLTTELQTLHFGETWLGLSDIAQEGVFVWDDGVLATDRYANWESGEPNDYGAGEDCAEMRPNDGDKTWNDITCTNVYQMVCEPQPQ